MRDILVICERHEPFDGSLTYAAHLARRLKGMLTGLRVVEPIIPSVPPEAAAIGSALMAEIQNTCARARDAAPAFARVLAEHGIGHGGWHAVLAPHAQAIAQFARWHDVLVFDAPQSGSLVSVARAGNIVLTSAAPCIVVPQDWTPSRELERIVVAWNGSLESVRALRAARSLLGMARRVTVLVGRTRHAPAIAMPPEFTLDAWAKREGLTVEHYPLEVPDERSGEELLSVATSMQADLLVMGGYGRGRFNEWLLGGATRHVLMETRLPVFMMH